MDDMPEQLEALVTRIERDCGHGNQRQANVVDVLTALTPTDLATLAEGMGRYYTSRTRRESIR